MLAMKKNIKKFLSAILTLVLVVECFYVMSKEDTVKAENDSQNTTEWVTLGTNDGLEWNSDTSVLENQTIQLKSTKVKKLRFYVTDVFGTSFKLHELEVFDNGGNNLTSSGRWAKSVDLSTTMTKTKQDVNFLCNGNGGTTGFSSSSDGNWDYFEVTHQSSEEYIEINFNKEVEVESFGIWTTYARSSQGWGNGPKKWKVMGEIEQKVDKDGFTLIGDNSSCAWSGDTSTGAFECQEIVFENPVWTNKIRLKVTGVYGSEYKISEFETFTTDNINVLGLITTDSATVNNAEYPYLLTSDKRRRMNYLAEINFPDGMPSTNAEMMINGENYSNDAHWYKRTGVTTDTLSNEYIEFVFDRPYEIERVKLWSNYCWNSAQGWGNAPKSWEVYAYKVQEKIKDDLTSLDNWSEITGFTLEDGKIKPSGESKMYAGTTAMDEYRLESELFVQGGQMGLITHYIDDDNCYRTVVDKTTDKVLLYKGTNLVTENYWPIEDKVTLAITVNGTKVSVWADEVKMMDYIDDSPVVAGKYGLYASDATGYFESVTVSPIDVADILPADYPYKPTAEAITEEMTSGDFYVAENGSDANDGKSIDKPFATIQKAQEAVREAKNSNPNKDYVVIIRGGTYYLDNTLSMTKEDGGQNQYRVTYAAYQDETPVVSGGKKVTSTWNPCEDEDKQGIYVTTLPEEFKNVDVRQLFIENSRATRSREPDAGETENNVDKNGHWLVTDVDTDNYQWVTPQGQLPQSWAELGGTGVELHARASWRYYRQEVKDFDIINNKITVKNGTIGIRYVGPHLRTTVGDWLYFENALKFVDTPNEWYYDKSTNQLYYYPENGENPNNLDMVIPCLEKVLDIAGTKDAPVENLDFYGLQFSHTTWYMPECGRIVAQAGKYEYYADDSTTKCTVKDPIAAVCMKYAEKINIQNCDFTMLGEGGIQAIDGTHSSRIDSCTFTDVGVYGVYLGNASQRNATKFESKPEDYDTDDTPRGNVICNNYFNSCGVTDLSSVAIFCTYANHTTIERNTIKNMPYTGISVGWLWECGLYSSHHNEILSNRISDCMNVVYDGGGIYTLGSQYNSRIENNYVKATAATNIYLDEGSRFIYCKNNYMLDAEIFYHMLPEDELKTLYVSDNHKGDMPANPEDYGCISEENGDINYDGVTDIRDIVRIKKHLAGQSVKIDRVASDLNMDSWINEKDLLCMRSALIEPSYTGTTNYTTPPATDYLTAGSLVSTTANAGLDMAKRLCDGNYGQPYDSGSDLELPEEFVFKFDTAIETDCKLQLLTNYASEQGPSRIDIYVQRGSDDWVQIKKCHLNWQSVAKTQCIEIPLSTQGITGIKIVTKEANLSWNHYLIAELDLIPVVAD